MVTQRIAVCLSVETVITKIQTATQITLQAETYTDITLPTEKEADIDLGPTITADNSAALILIIRIDTGLRTQTLALLSRSTKITSIGRKGEVRPPGDLGIMTRMIRIMGIIPRMRMTKGGESACLADMSR